MSNHIHYQVSLLGETGFCSFASDRYSKYNERALARDAGTLKGLVYGPAQCREHIAELRRAEYPAGVKPYANSTFVISKVVTKITRTLVRP